MLNPKFARRYLADACVSSCKSCIEQVLQEAFLAKPARRGTQLPCQRGDSSRRSMQYRRDLLSCIDFSRHFNSAGSYCIDFRFSRQYGPRHSFRLEFSMQFSSSRAYCMNASRGEEFRHASAVAARRRLTNWFKWHIFKPEVLTEIRSI